MVSNGQCDSCLGGQDSKTTRLPHKRRYGIRRCSCSELKFKLDLSFLVSPTPLVTSSSSSSSCRLLASGIPQQSGKTSSQVIFSRLSLFVNCFYFHFLSPLTPSHPLLPDQSSLEPPRSSYRAEFETVFAHSFRFD